MMTVILIISSAQNLTANQNFNDNSDVPFTGDIYTVVFEEYQPYEFTENGAVKGMNIEILQAIAQKAGIRFNFKSEDWDIAMQMIREGKVDAVSSLFKTPEREEFLYFPRRGLSLEVNRFYVRANFTKPINKIEDIKGMTIGTMVDYSYGADFDNFKNIKRVESAENEIVIEKFIKGEYEIFIMNDFVARDVFKKNGYTDYKEIEFIPCQEYLFLGISKAKAGGDVLLEKVDRAMTELAQDGTLNKIRERYMY
jgi:polar amino acid transport system substrate-binding protein